MRSSLCSGSLLFVLSACGEPPGEPSPDHVDGMSPPVVAYPLDVGVPAPEVGVLVADPPAGASPVEEIALSVEVGVPVSSPQVEVVASVTPESPPRVIRVKAVPMWDAPVGTEMEPVPATTEPVPPPPVEDHVDHTLQQEVQEKVQQVNDVNTEALEILNAIRKKKGLAPLPPDPIEKDPPPNEPMPVPSKAKD